MREAKMTNLELNENERDVLALALDASLNRLVDEISHTDTRDYKVFLKERKDVLVKIREMLH
jgi:hypothetical protein